MESRKGVGRETKSEAELAESTDKNVWDQFYVLWNCVILRRSRYKVHIYLANKITLISISILELKHKHNISI